MKENIKKWLKPILFTAGGALVGLAYYYFVGCSTGACPLTSNPFITMAYMGFIGWLLSGVFGNICKQISKNTNQFYNEQHRQCQYLQYQLHRLNPFLLTTLYKGICHNAMMSTLM